MPLHISEIGIKLSVDPATPVPDDPATPPAPQATPPSWLQSIINTCVRRMHAALHLLRSR